MLPDALIAHAGSDRRRGVHGAWAASSRSGSRQRRRAPRPRRASGRGRAASPCRGSGCRRNERSPCHPMSRSCWPRCSRCSRRATAASTSTARSAAAATRARSWRRRRCTLWAIDRDPDAIARGASLAARFPGRLHLLHGQFGDMLELLAERGVTALDGVVLDLRRLVLPARRSGARLLVPRRRPARHAHGTRRPDRGRSGQHAAGARAGRPAVRARRGTRIAPHRPRHRRRRARRAQPITHDGATRGDHPSACCRPTVPASIPRRAASRRCASG